MAMSRYGEPLHPRWEDMEQERERERMELAAQAKLDQDETEARAAILAATGFEMWEELERAERADRAYMALRSPGGYDPTGIFCGDE
jgi:hypothetical protein